MITLHAELEALMPKPYIRRSTFDDLYTATQMREAILAATERAAKKAADLAYVAAIKYADGDVVDFDQEVAAAIRGASGQEGGGAL